MSSSIAVAADSTQSEQHGERRRKTSSERKHKRRGPEPKKTKKGQRTQQKKVLSQKNRFLGMSGDKGHFLRINCKNESTYMCAYKKESSIDLMVVLQK